MVKCVSAKAQDENIHWNTSKTNNCTKFSIIDLVLIYTRNLSGTRPKPASSKSASYQFSISATRNAITKATEYPTFCFLLHILVFSPSRKVLESFFPSKNVTVCKQCRFLQCFSSHNVKKFPQMTLNLEWGRLCCSLINLAEWCK